MLKLTSRNVQGFLLSQEDLHGRHLAEEHATQHAGERPRMELVWSIVANLDALVTQAVKNEKRSLPLLPLRTEDLSAGESAPGSDPQIPGAQFKSPILRYLWDHLDRAGLNPHIAIGEQGAASIALQVPDMFKASGRRSPDQLSATMEVFDRILEITRDFSTGLAGSYSDRHTLSFAREYMKADPDCSKLSYEKLLTLLENCHERSKELRVAVNALAACSYASPGGKGVNEEAAVDLHNALASPGIKPETALIYIHSSLTDFFRCVRDDITPLTAGQEQDKDIIAGNARHGICACMAALEELHQYCCPAEERPGKNRAAQVSVEALDSMPHQSLARLEQLAREAPSARELLASPNRKGGVVFNNYYSTQYFKTALHEGALLLTHWQPDPASGARTMTGFVLCNKADVELLCVSKNAAPGAAYRLIDRLVIELQSRGHESCGAWISGLNWSSFRFAVNKGWIPDLIPRFSADGEREKAPEAGCWVHGRMHIRPRERAQQVKQMQRTLSFLERGFIRQTRQAEPPAESAPSASGTETRQAAVILRQQGPEPSTTTQPGGAASTTFAPLRRAMKGLLEKGRSLLTGKWLPTLDVRSLDEFIDLARVKINIMPQVEPEGLLRQLQRGFGIVNYADYLLRHESVTASGRMITYKENIYSDWIGTGGREWTGMRGFAGLPAYVAAIERRNEIRRRLPDIAAEVFMHGSGPLTQREEAELMTMARTRKKMCHPDVPLVDEMNQALAAAKQAQNSMMYYVWPFSPRYSVFGQMQMMRGRRDTEERRSRL